MEMLNGPHLMLTHIRCNDGILRHHIADGLQHLLGGQLAGLILIFCPGGIGEYKLLPPVIVLLLYTLIQQLQHPARITDDVMIGLDILINFRPVNVDLNDLRLTGKALRIQRHTI